MFSVSIVGAGELGGAVARAIAHRGRAGRIRLIDDEERVAAGKALDIQQAGPISASDVVLTGASDLADAADAAVIVIADRAATNDEWVGDPGLMIVRRLLAFGVTAPFVFAGTSARGLMERAASELKVKPGRLIGSAPDALVSAVRAFVAMETNGSPNDVCLSIVGVPPVHAVVPWADASIGGFSAARVLDPSSIARIERRIPALWPPGPGVLAAAAARVAEAVASGSRRMFCCFAFIDGRGMIAAVPIRVSERGIDRVVVPPLDTRERVIFENSVAR